MTKSTLFKEAHKRAKTYQGNYQARFSLALSELKRWDAFFKSIQDNYKKKHSLVFFGDLITFITVIITIICFMTI